MLRGFIDESYEKVQKKGELPRLFTLSCIVGYDNMLPWFEMAWAKVLEETNAALAKQGRKTLTRYHASYCSSSHGEFEGWTNPEKVELTLKLLKVFQQHPLHIHGYDLPLQLLVQEIPETKANPIGFAYVLLLILLMSQIAEKTMTLYPLDKISLHHDQSEYDGALADAFKLVVNDPNFKGGDKFSSISPEQWQHCVMLQPADLLTYENFKEGMQTNFPNPHVKGRRKSLQALLDLDSISGRASGLGVDAIRQLKKIIDGLDPANKKSLFDAARIKMHE